MMQISYWRMLMRPQPMRKIGLNLCGALLLVFLLHASASRYPLDAVREPLLDISMKIGSDLAPVTSGPAPYAVVAIDGTTHRLWGEPFLVPRDALAALIDAVSNLGPALIVVNVTIDRVAGEHDGALADTLARLAGQPGAPILLARGFRPRIAADELPLMRPWPPEAALKDNHRVFWTSPLMEYADNGDGMLRRAGFVAFHCGPADATAIPSLHLAAAVLLGTPAEERRERLGGVLRQMAPDPDGACSGAADGSPRLQPASLRLAEQRAITVDPADATVRRVNFSIPWRPPSGRGHAEVTFHGVPVPLVNEIPAWSLLDAASSGSGTRGEALIRGRIVLIGTTHGESGDRFVTPLGVMPGVYAALNAIDTLVRTGPPRPPSLIVNVAIEALLIVILTALFGRWPRSRAPQVIAVIVAVPGLLLAAAWLRLGIWYDLAIPLVALKTYDGAVAASEFLRKVHSHVRLPGVQRQAR